MGAVHTLDPNLAVYQVQTADELLTDSVARQKTTAVLLAIFFLVALALASIGIYGVLSCSVAQRTREIGLRMALGAHRAHILRLVLTQAARLAGTGLAIGEGAAIFGDRVVSGLLFDTGSADPFSVCLTIGILALIAAMAAAIPAIRAASMNPNEALRAE